MAIEAKLDAFLEESEIVLIPVEIRNKLSHSFDTFNTSVKSLKREYDDFKVLKGEGCLNLLLIGFASMVCPPHL